MLATYSSLWGTTSFQIHINILQRCRSCFTEYLPAATACWYLLKHCFTCLGLADLEPLVFSLAFFSVQGPSSKTHGICFSWLLKKSSSSISENKPSKLLLQQRRRTACGKAARDCSKHQQQLWLLGLPQSLLKACAHLWAHGSEPHKMRFQICLGWSEKLIHSFSTEEKRNCVHQSLLRERITWREESSRHTCMHALITRSAVLHWVQSATN